jgi:hypothetical protein
MLALLAAVRAAAEAPLWLREPRLGALLRPAGVAPGGAPGDRAERAVVHSRRVLALLARLPRSPWRNTCLFRSAAECLVLRRHGIDAHVEIGVRRDGDSVDGVAAHAWVVAGSAAARDPSSGQYRPFGHARPS